MSAQIEAPNAPKPTSFRVWDWLSTAFYPLAALALLILAWFTVSWLLRPPPYILPSPQHVWDRFTEEAPSLLENTAATVEVALAGLLVAVLAGLALGFSIAWWGSVRRLLLPPIIVTQSIPKIALAPLFVVWFGYGAMPKLLVVVLVTFFPIVEACTVGVRSLPQSVFTLSQSMGLRSFSLFFRILLPASMPFLAGAFQVSASLALIGALTAEFVGAEKGIGVVLRTAVGFQDTALAFAGILLCAVTGTIIYVASILISGLALKAVSPGYARSKF
ncbi:MAG: ABC transporter permease [Mesorhizobium sp.]